AVGGSWAINANEYGRLAALLLLAIFGVSLLSPRVAGGITQPVVDFGNRLLNASSNGATASPASSLLLGVATGLLWAPCAGPILGAILSSAMLQGASSQTSLLLLAYGLGSACSLGLLIVAGRGLVARLKPLLPVTSWLRRGTGVAALLAAVSIATGVDRQLYEQASSESSNAVERSLLENVPKAIDYVISKADAAPLGLRDHGTMPSLDGAVQWLNSPPLTAESLRGKVVLVDFWTFDCINCQRSLPYVNQWAKKYEKDGLVVIGVHTPEFAFEKLIANVQREVKKLDIAYPVAIDNDYAIWRAFDNQYWPAHYFIDAKGRVRFSHFGEGRYDTQEQVIQQLLEEARAERETGATKG
ncbi:MAG TPA: redoxin domain-containing protein, partial [Pseudomonas sp.]|nr:redoxin domain-containing protein [Pseudomonas sp.]